MKTKLTLLGLFLFSMVFNLQAQILYSVPSYGGAPTQNRNSQTVTDWLHYDGDNSTRIGNPNAAYTIGAYAKLTNNLLNPHIGRQIEELQFYIGDLTKMNGDLEIRFYSDLSSAPLYTQTVSASTLTTMDWNTVVLTTPFQITNGNDLYVGYYADMQAGYFIGADDGSNFATNSNYFIFNGTQYENNSAGLPYNWNIRAGVGGATSTNDCGMTDIAVNDIILPGNQQISGALTNYGSASLTQVDVNYSVNGGTTQTETLSGLNLATGDSYNFTFNTPWSATPGTYSIDVWVSNFNGNGQDDVAGNDHLTKTVQVASQTTQKLPLFEEFTSSTCAPCAGFNSNSFNSAFLNSNAGHFSLIKYQMNWPQPGDPYYTAEGGERRAYYGVTGVPTLLLDGHNDDFFGTPGNIQPDLDAAYQSSGYFDMTANYAIDANNGITVNVSIEPYLNGDYTLHCAVVEKTTTGNIGSNGETEFFNVMMKMVPDANGTTASLAIGQTFTTTLNSVLVGTNIEDYNDLEVVVFLQDDNNKNVMQSVVASDTNSISDEVLNNISVYPNPTNSNVFIKGAENMDIELLNITGAVIIRKSSISNITSINVENLQAGMYLIKFTQNNKSGVKKLMITK